MRSPHSKPEFASLKFTASKFTAATPLLVLTLLLLMFISGAVSSGGAQQTNPYTEARWLRKLHARQTGPTSTAAAASSNIRVGTNVDVSNEPGPQSEVFIAVDTQNPGVLAAGSNEIFRNPQRTYFSTDGGASWMGADQPLVDEQGTTWSFASDPGVAIDTRGTIFFSQLLIASVDDNFKGDAMIVNSTTDGGATFSPGRVLKKDLNAGALGRFEDKPFITCDTNLASQFRDNVYVAWDTTQGAGTSRLNLARSTDHGVTFSLQRIDDTNSGNGAAEIGADPAVGPNGEVYVAWLDSRIRRFSWIAPLTAV